MDIQNFQLLNPEVKYTCTRFDFETHPHLIFEWMEARGMEVPDELNLPKVGFILGAKNYGPIAIGFLRRCEGNVGMIDSMITNPAIPAKLRNEALDLLIIRLVSSAKRRKIFKIMGYSQDENTLLRAQRHGFHLVSQSLIALTVS